MSGDDRDRPIEHMERAIRRWRAVAFAALALFFATLGWGAALLETTQRLEQRVEVLARLERDFERLKRQVEQLEKEVPALHEAAEERAEEERIVPVFLETAPDGSQRRGSLFPDDQMYREFDIPSQPRVINPGDQIVRPLDTHEAEK